MNNRLFDWCRQSIQGGASLEPNQASASGWPFLPLGGGPRSLRVRSAEDPGLRRAVGCEAGIWGLPA